MTSSPTLRLERSPYNGSSTPSLWPVRRCPNPDPTTSRAFPPGRLPGRQSLTLICHRDTSTQQRGHRLAGDRCCKHPSKSRPRPKAEMGALKDVSKISPPLRCSISRPTNQRTNQGSTGLRSIARNNKATRLFTRPGCAAKSSAKDLSLRTVKLQCAN